MPLSPINIRSALLNRAPWGAPTITNNLVRSGDDNDDNDDRAAGNAPTTTNSSSNPVGGSSNGTGLNGDFACPTGVAGSQLLCVTAFVNGSTVTYELQSNGEQKLGWMAVGFGQQMANSPMVIMWPNSSQSIALSQRQAPTEIMPTPVANPPRVATPMPTLSDFTSSQPKLVFTIEGTATKVPLIWAFGIDRPADDPNSGLNQHLDSGPFNLDLTKTLQGGRTIPQGSGSIPFQPYQKFIIAHAVLSAMGFLILLPAGALVARWTRTYSRKWFTQHWIIQSGLGGLSVIIGIILGFVAVDKHGLDIPSTHKTLGKVLLGLYLAQCALGVIIHFFKMKFPGGRPPQNYLHAVLGLAIIALSFYQVRLGYMNEWPNATGRGPAPNAIHIVWTVWLVVLALAYAVGLGLLPRQFRQEKATRYKGVAVVESEPSSSVELPNAHNQN